MWLSHGLALLGTPSESKSVGFSPGPFTPWSQGRTPSLLFARVSCEVLPRSGAEQELPLLPLEGRRMEEFVDPFLNPRSLVSRPHTFTSVCESELPSPASLRG